MNDKYSISKKLKTISVGFIVLGIITVTIGFFTNTEKTLANLLLSNYYFISIAVGATFFYAIQYITQSGWSAQFQRIPIALGAYLPLGALLMLLLMFGMGSLYEWTHPHTEELKELMEHKEAYLNIPFFVIRLIVYFALWIFMTRLLLRTSLKEDQEGGLVNFKKSEIYSKIYIFILAISFSLFTFDVIMSLDIAWYSTLFAVKNFISAFYHGVAVIILMVLLLNRLGYFKSLSKSHLHSFSKYLFILSLVWVYLWFFQFLVIWFGNLEEEVVYYIARQEGSWKILFILNIILNWTIPFFVLMPLESKHSKKVIAGICVLLLVGMWVDLYLQIMPDTIGELGIGIIEIGVFSGYIGLFILTVTKALSRIPVIPKNHPYLSESIEN